MTKQLVQRGRKLLDESPGASRAPEQIASRLQASWHDLKRLPLQKLVKQLKETVLPELQRSEKERSNASLGPDSKKRRRDDEDSDEEDLYVIDKNGDAMTKGGQRLVTYPDANRANNRLRQQYSRSVPGAADDTNLNMGGAAAGESGAGTPVPSRVRAGGTVRSARKLGGKREAAEHQR